MTSAFLTDKLARQALAICTPSIEALLQIEGVRRSALYVVILKPGSEEILASGSFGTMPRGIWPHPFENIALGKARLSQRTGMDTAMVLQFHAHLLVEGDPKYAGGVNRHGIPVGASGIQSYLDVLVAGMVADTCQALCQHALQTIIEDEALNFIPAR